MCYFLYLASPLTLSEVRSMLPAGLRADPVDRGESEALRHHHPEAQTVLQLVHGACSCDLVRERQPVTREDESHLRTRYRAQGLSRDLIIRALDNHRRAAQPRQVRPGHWPEALARFALEHARNAGPSLFYLQFSHHGRLTLPEDPTPVEVGAATVREAPTGWLPEGRLVLLSRPREIS